MPRSHSRSPHSAAVEWGKSAHEATGASHGGQGRGKGFHDKDKGRNNNSDLSARRATRDVQGGKDKGKGKGNGKGKSGKDSWKGGKGKGDASKDGKEGKAQSAAVPLEVALCITCGGRAGANVDATCVFPACRTHCYQLQQEQRTPCAYHGAVKNAPTQWAFRHAELHDTLVQQSSPSIGWRGAVDEDLATIVVERFGLVEKRIEPLARVADHPQEQQALDTELEQFMAAVAPVSGEALM